MADTLVAKIDGTRLFLLFATALAILFFWDSQALYPVRIMVVFFHEMSHALAGLLTGGEVIEISVVEQEGGHTLIRGGSRFFTLSAGYLGSMLWGGALLLSATRASLVRPTTVALGAILVGVALTLVEPTGSFGFWFAIIIGAALLAIGIKLHEGINELVLSVIGMTSCLYAIYDIKSDVLDRPHLRSDARMLADHTGVPTEVWGVIWIALAVILGATFAILASRRDRAW